MTSSHHPLISALTTFYNLLVDLRYIPASNLVHPPQSRRYPITSINRNAARDNGFSDAAIELAYQIPYITDEDYKIHYETHPLCYLTHVPDALEYGEELKDEPEESLTSQGEFAWEFARDPPWQERDDLWIGRDVLVLTQGALYGTELIYDLSNRKSPYFLSVACNLAITKSCIESITEWQHFEHQGEWWDLPAYPMSSPQNPIYNWIRASLALQNIPFDGDIILPHEPQRYGYPWHNPTEEELQQWQQRVESGRRERTIRDVYIQCGWNVNTAENLDEEIPIWEAIEQARQRAGKDFRGDEFEQRREEWKDRVWGSPR